MRQIVLDTETTGLDPARGHRIVEIGCVELVNRRLSGNNFHRYVNPGRDSDEAALEVHGLTGEFLADKPAFEDIAAELIDYVAGAEIIIHNAPFDVAFLDAELARVGVPPFRRHAGAITDSLVMAKERHPGRRNNLDALCERYQIYNSARTQHGALLDANLLAEVYLALTRGQDSLIIDFVPTPQATAATRRAAGKLQLIVIPASAEELAAHAQQLAEIDKASGGACVWQKLETAG